MNTIYRLQLGERSQGFGQGLQPHGTGELRIYLGQPGINLGEAIVLCKSDTCHNTQ